MHLRRQDLPILMTRVDNWVGWRLQARANSKKETKIPYSFVTGLPGSSTNPEDWCSFDDAVRHFNAGNYSGLGFVFSKELCLTGIDLDNCYTAEKKLKPWAAEKLREFRGTYCEISPSGLGIKIWARGRLPGSGLKVYVNAAGEPVKEGSPDVDGATEMYDTGRFFTVTGNTVGPPDIIDCQKQIDALYRKLRGNKGDASVSSPAVPPDTSAKSVSEGGRHAHLLATAALWHANGMSRSGKLAGLRQENKEKCSPPKTEHELEGIVEWLETKPQKYRLTPRDFDDSRKVINGEAIPATDAAEPPKDKQSAIDHAEKLLSVIIEHGKPDAIYSDAFFDAIAAAGDIKQFDAKRRLKIKFKQDFSVKEYDRRIKIANHEAQKQREQFSNFLLNADGKMLPCVANAIKMLETLSLAYNSFSCRPVLKEKSPWGTVGNWTDYDDTKAQEWCQLQGLQVPYPSMVAAAADALARLRPFSPIVDRLFGLVWDGVPRLDTWLTDYMGAPDSPYVRGVAAKWMISGVKRPAEPGCQADYTLMLEGGQGKRKSTALRILAGDQYFTDDIADAGSVASAMQLQGNHIVELSELGSLRRVEIEIVKAWLTRRFDKFRPPYGRRVETFPRQNIFAASTNKGNWGMDDTGLRRFWPIKVGEHIDIDGLAKVADQLWAEAVVRYKQGELIYFSPVAETLATTEQKLRQDEDIWKDPVEAWLINPSQRNGGYGTTTIYSTRGHIYFNDIPWHCLGINEKDWTGVHKIRIARILTLAGYVKEKSPEDEREIDGRCLDYWNLK